MHGKVDVARGSGGDGSFLISFHKQATTGPKILAAIRTSMEPAWPVSERYWISEQTVWRWCSLDDLRDRSHTLYRLQTTLTPAEYAVALRKAFLLPLDELHAVVREFLNPDVSRSRLGRWLRRNGTGNMQAFKPKDPRPTHGSFKAYAPGYRYIDIKYLPKMVDESARL